jgi:hypothetical protein
LPPLARRRRRRRRRAAELFSNTIDPLLETPHTGHLKATTIPPPTLTSSLPTTIPRKNPGVTGRGTPGKIISTTSSLLDRLLGRRANFPSLTWSTFSDANASYRLGGILGTTYQDGLQQSLRGLKNISAAPCRPLTACGSIAVLEDGGPSQWNYLAVIEKRDFPSHHCQSMTCSRFVLYSFSSLCTTRPSRECALFCCYRCKNKDLSAAVSLSIALVDIRSCFCLIYVVILNKDWVKTGRTIGLRNKVLIWSTWIDGLQISATSVTWRKEVALGLGKNVSFVAPRQFFCDIAKRFWRRSCGRSSPVRCSWLSGRRRIAWAHFAFHQRRLTICLPDLAIIVYLVGVVFRSHRLPISTFLQSSAFGALHSTLDAIKGQTKSQPSISFYIGGVTYCATVLQRGAGSIWQCKSGQGPLVHEHEKTGKCSRKGKKADVAGHECHRHNQGCS